MRRTPSGSSSRERACPDGASTPAQISICSHCERGWQDGAGFRAELAPAEIATASCDAEHLGTVEGELVRKTSTLSERKRKRIITRDHHRCAAPGCRSRKYLDVHHIVHQEHGGGHEDWNLITLCSGHHRMHHRGWLAIDGRAPDGISFEWKNRPGEETNEHAHVGTNVRPVGSPTEAPNTASRFGHTVMETQARDALVGLGWKRRIAHTAVDEAAAHQGPDVPIERLIQEALRRCPKPLCGAR